MEDKDKCELKIGGSVVESYVVSIPPPADGAQITIINRDEHDTLTVVLPNVDNRICLKMGESATFITPSAAPAPESLG